MKNEAFFYLPLEIFSCYQISLIKEKLKSKPDAKILYNRCHTRNKKYISKKQEAENKLQKHP